MESGFLLKPSCCKVGNLTACFLTVVLGFENQGRPDKALLVSCRREFLLQKRAMELHSLPHK